LAVVEVELRLGNPRARDDSQAWQQLEVDLAEGSELSISRTVDAEV
jgi:hypothetical protein